MEKIYRTIDTFDRLREYRYLISIENGMQLLLRFSREQYHHLAGFQHLTDLRDIAAPRSKQEFYHNLKKGKISPARIKKSCQYHMIRERIECFSVLEDILAPGDSKIIVEFDNRKMATSIRAKFHLFHREGDPFQGEATFFTLFIDSKNGDQYYPVTYIVEHSNMYIRNQNLFNCTIERQRIGKKELSPV